MAAVTLVVGPPCGGKTTYVREHRKSGDLVVDFDALALAIGGDEMNHAPEHLERLAGDLRERLIEKVLGGVDFDAWVIATRPAPEQVDAFVEAGATILLADPGKDVALARAKEDGLPTFTAGAIGSWYNDPPALPDGVENVAGGDPEPAGDDSGSKAAHGGQVFRKTAAVEVKATRFTEDGLPGGFTGYAAVFGNVDLGGDMIVKGAFADCLQARFPGEGAGVPVYWNHNLDDPFSNIGVTRRALEDDHGLFVDVELDTATSWGKQVARLLKDGRVTQMSFTFDVQEGAFVESDELGAYYELRKLNLFEVSVVPIGMNQATEILSVKSAMEQAPRVPVPEPADVKSGGPRGAGRLETAARRLRAMDL